MTVADGTVLSVFGTRPSRVGAIEIFAQALSRALEARGRRSVLGFEQQPSLTVQRFLSAPNVSLEVVESCWRSDLAGARAVGRVVARHRPEILHLYFTGYLGPYPWLARALGTRRVFFTDQASRPEGYQAARAPLWKRMAARAINWPLSGWIAVSRYNQECIEGLDLVPSGRLHMIYNGVDLARAAEGARAGATFRRQWQIPEDALVVAQVSWLIPEKGVADLLEAAALVLRRHPQAHFLIVGEGAQAARLIQQAEELDIAKHVTWTGLVQDPLASGVFAAADVVCQVSRWEEAFGFVIAEGMAAARPVVATRVGGIPELVSDGETGYLVARGDVEAIADRILFLLDDVEARRRLGEAGGRAAAARFGLEGRIDQLMTLYGI